MVRQGGKDSYATTPPPPDSPRALAMFLSFVGKKWRETLGLGQGPKEAKISVRAAADWAF